MNYTDIIASKTGLPVPCRGATSFHSTYNPQKEAASFAAQFAQPSRFFVILGICGAYHIAALRQRFPEANVIAVEESKEDIAFLLRINAVKEAQEDSRVVLTDCSALKRALLQKYKPHIHGNLVIAALRQWESTFPDAAQKARRTIADALALVSADYSVQSHFGKVWQKNIFENLKLSAHLRTNADELLRSVPSQKTAAIVAAGPSFDDTCRTLAERRNDFFVIATDTAFTSLSARNIVPDAVVSVDGQMISHAHFFGRISGDTVFVFDLCANPSAAKKVARAGGNVLFSESNHPLAQYASRHAGGQSFIHLETGSGTVTIAAASFAERCGFKKLAFFGADFSYSRGKTYTKSTYLDTLYRTQETRTQTAETAFNRLLFRTELLPLPENRRTTRTLESYRASLSDFLRAHGFAPRPDGVFARSAAAGREPGPNAPFDFSLFVGQYAQKLKEAFSTDELPGEENPLVLTLLPLCAWIESHKKYATSGRADSPLRIAYQHTLLYTELL